MDRKELLLTYIENNVVPILVDFISGSDLGNAIILPASISKSELNGHYEGKDFFLLCNYINKFKSKLLSFFNLL